MFVSLKEIWRHLGNVGLVLQMELRLGLELKSRLQLGVELGLELVVGLGFRE